ncbi:hypothetical protein FOQG_18819 [Fusarium oxysporum f. sp. raphani 54005]|uniref:AB hydrolase-1 domain-containing protein n=2 Tax=Fusarium oxysporum f. sp. raphani TaxID=96318 RepID=X0B3V7_FUSOX|nr:hypothetical protein FOQG_18819 [Fusarium oxysporum f. sp. raphani 54005]KAG7418586.1 Protein SERAC1 [Fusarium oxysporum f. sp. raphani]
MSQYGLTKWHDAEDKAVVDIVFVHGLRGGRESTWTKDGVIWPKELLAKDMPKSRILSFGYDASIVHSDTADVTQGSLVYDARELCSLLDAERKRTNTANRPIVVVGHSLGGLVLAQVVYGGNAAAEGDSINSIAQKVTGMIFLGTPFYGSKIAGWGDAVRRIYDLIRKTDKNTLKNLNLDSARLKGLREGFPEVIRKRNQTSTKIAVVFFFERKTTYGVWIVKEENAAYPGVGEILPMQANHIDICKFDDVEDDGYKKVKAKIKEALQAAEITGDEGSNTYIINNDGKIVNLAQRDIQIDTQTINFN